MRKGVTHSISTEKQEEQETVWEPQQMKSTSKNSASKRFWNLGKSSLKFDYSLLFTWSIGGAVHILSCDSRTKGRTNESKIAKSGVGFWQILLSIFGGLIENQLVLRQRKRCITRSRKTWEEIESVAQYYFRTLRHRKRIRKFFMRCLGEKESEREREKRKTMRDDDDIKSECVFRFSLTLIIKLTINLDDGFW